jgi:hypothetical protein
VDDLPLNDSFSVLKMHFETLCKTLMNTELREFDLDKGEQTRINKLNSGDRCRLFTRYSARKLQFGDSWDSLGII